MAGLQLLSTLLLSAHAMGAAPAAATASNATAAAGATGPLGALIYNHGGPNSVNRSLLDVLRERVSVKDFGARGDCSKSAPTGSDCVDDTAAFAAAIGWAAESGGPVTVHVPRGSYRLDGTVMWGKAEVVLERGATLRRIATYTNNTAPLIRLPATHGILRGSGTLTTENPSPRGLVNGAVLDWLREPATCSLARLVCTDRLCCAVGPANLSVYSNVEFNIVEGVTLLGGGFSHFPPGDDVRSGSRGLGMDSSQGWAMTHGDRH